MLRTLPVLMLCSLAATAAVAAEPYPLIAGDGPNRLVNPDLERLAGDQLTGWNAYEAGYSVDAGRRGGHGARCTRRAAADRGTGLSQAVTLNQTRPRPIVATAWSRAEGVDGQADADYSLYCDLIYTDGTPLWGQIATFDVGTHDWQQARVAIAPDKPVKSILVYGLFRKHLGTAWFGDFAVAELTDPASGGRLDGLGVKRERQERELGGQAVRAGRLELQLDGDAATGVTLDGRNVGSRAAGGFLARDVAADSGWHSFEGGACPALGLKLDYQAVPHDTHLEIKGRVSDVSGQPRAITLMFAVPLTPDGWRWGRSLRREEPVEGAAEFTDLVNVGVGANGQMSRCPLAHLSRPEGGLNLAVDPEAPAQYRLGYSHALGLFYVAYDFALTPAVTASPSAAAFSFALFASRGDWGYRGGLEVWQKVYPEAFQVRIPDQGIWMAFASTSKVGDWQDFGFRFKEGDNETAWDNAHGLLTFRYSEMGTYWMAMPPTMPRTYDEAFKLLQAQAADRSKAWAWRSANAVLGSGSQDAGGRFQCRFLDTPWCNGAVWSQNPSPYLSAPLTQSQLAWGPDQQRAYEPGAKAQLAGEYLDSLEGYVTADLNYRPDHLAACRIPPTFDLRGRRPVVYKIFSIAEFAHALSHDLHDRGRLIMANGVPFRFGFLSAWFDVTGTETNWCHDGVYSPDSDDTLSYRRAMSGTKPYLLLMNTDFGPFGLYVERYFARALAYGMYPSMFSHDAATLHYFEHPEWYNRDRELFKKYQPLIRKVAEEGWQPVTLARCDNPALQLERFGPGRTGHVYLTVHNPGPEAQSGRLTFDQAALGRPAAARGVTVAGWGTEVVEP
jgi:hypothetical protein